MVDFNWWAYDSNQGRQANNFLALVGLFLSLSLFLCCDWYIMCISQGSHSLTFCFGFIWPTAACLIPGFSMAPPQGKNIFSKHFSWCTSFFNTGDRHSVSRKSSGMTHYDSSYSQITLINGSEPMSPKETKNYPSVRGYFSTTCKTDNIPPCQVSEVCTQQKYKAESLDYLLTTQIMCMSVWKLVHWVQWGLIPGQKIAKLSCKKRKENNCEAGSSEK